MTSQGGSGDRTPPFGQPAAPQPWQQHPYAPVDPQAPLNYPEYPPNYPPPYGMPPQQPPSYGMPPPYYPGPYDPYSHYRGPAPTNGLAVASLVTSIAGVLIGIPLSVFYVGVLIPIMAVVLGGIALSQIRLTNQQGRGMAIAGITIGASTLALVVVSIVFVAAAVHSLRLVH